MPIYLCGRSWVNPLSAEAAEPQSGKTRKKKTHFMLPSVITSQTRRGQIELNVLWQNTILPCSVYRSDFLSRFTMPMPGFSEYGGII